MCVRHVVEGALAWAWASRARVLETDVCAVGVSVGVEGVGVSVVCEGKHCQQNQKNKFISTYLLCCTKKVPLAFERGRRCQGGDAMEKEAGRQTRS
jgi:hypothetical protein